ncbi:hypothetical protein J3Q64DRAFT_1833347 [Phycomyces blakesleeanus]|uniref:Uncharacterized protein n=1 Tax=Phycomyces blakesleeanus TaxID=4837 RepID=A0ABR3B336_PHYBL
MLHEKLEEYNSAFEKIMEELEEPEMPEDPKSSARQQQTKPPKKFLSSSTLGNNFLFTSISQSVAALPTPIASRPSNAQEVQGDQQTLVAASEHLVALQNKMDSSSKIVLEGPTKESIRRIENTVSDILTSMEIIKKTIADRTLPAGSMPANNVHSSSNGQFAHRMRSSDVSFKGTDPKKIAENNSRPGWDLTSNFHSINYVLAKSLLTYLQGQGNILTSDVLMSKMADIVMNHFSNQQKESRKSEEEGNKKRQKAEDIREQLFFAFQKDVFSERHSDNEDSLTMFQPS